MRFMTPRKLFFDRADAGQQLAERLARYGPQQPIVLALPRGGVAIGFEVAKKLGALLDVLVARKLGAPGNPEFGIGAIAEGGIMLLNQKEIPLLGIKQEEMEDLVAKESAEMERRIRLFRGNRHNPQVSGRVVILVDDGLATGVTARAAIESLRLAKPAKLVFAVPVCAKESSAALKSLVDELVCLYEPEDFIAVGEWYEDFPQLSDEEVVRLLDEARETIQGAKP